MNIETTKKVTYPTLDFKKKGRLILTNEVLAQIFFHHSSIGSVEWSGILLYEVVSGSPADPDNFVLKAKHIFLMDIGTSGFTAYDTDGDIVDIYDNIPEAMEMKIGQIHTHHTMSAFFSGTDTEELNDNVDKHNYYLSLIVNFSGNYTAKVAFLMEKKTVSTISYMDDSGQPSEFVDETEGKSMGLIEMDIVMDYHNDFFYKRLKEIKDDKKKKEEAAKAKKSTSEITRFGQGTKTVNGGRNMGMGKSFTDNSISRRTGIVSPWTMTDREVSSLLSQLISVTVNLTERRDPYILLIELTKSDMDRGNFYETLLSSNITDILESFFERVLTKNEKRYVMSELTPLVRRHSSTKKVRKIAEKIISVFSKYANGDYDNGETDGTVTIDDLNKEILKI
jgi:hypothetical protein